MKCFLCKAWVHGGSHGLNLGPNHGWLWTSDCVTTEGLGQLISKIPSDYHSGVLRLQMKGSRWIGSMVHVHLPRVVCPPHLWPLGLGGLIWMSPREQACGRGVPEPRGTRGLTSKKLYEQQGPVPLPGEGEEGIFHGASSSGHQA